MRRSAVGKRRREVARIGRAFGPVEVLDPREKRPALGLAHRALADVEVWSPERAHRPRGGGLPLVMDARRRWIGLQLNAQARLPGDAVAVANSFGELSGIGGTGKRALPRE